MLLSHNNQYKNVGSDRVTAIDTSVPTSGKKKTQRSH